MEPIVYEYNPAMADAYYHEVIDISPKELEKAKLSGKVTIIPRYPDEEEELDMLLERIYSK